MGADRCHGVSTWWSRCITRRRVTPGVLKGLAIGAGLLGVRGHATVRAANDHSCCGHRRRDYQHEKKACERDGGVFGPATFQCNRETCPNTNPVYSCAHPAPDAAA